MILRLEFLGPYAAAELTRKDAPEWPPHPDRIFQSLVDASCMTDAAQVDALRWLEQQQPPSLGVPDAVPMQPADTFVPVNYPGVPLDLDAREKQPRSFPLVWPKGRVELMWDDPPAPVFETLQRIADRVSHVGRAESQVLATIEGGQSAANYVPNDAGDLHLRVPFAGRLDALELAFRSGRYAPPAPPVTYAMREGLVQRGPWSELITLRLRHPWSLARVVDAADGLRRAVLSLLGDDAPPAIHGHADTPAGKATPHVAWLGLPNLSPFARGELLGLGVAVPVDMSSQDRARLVQAVLGLDHVVINGRSVAVERPSHALSLDARSWTRPSRRWRSVTPVVLDRYPKARKLTAEDIVLSGLVAAGYPRPTKVYLTDGASVQGGLPSSAFRLRRPGRLFSHIEIEFDTPVRGPVLAGAERHFGLGLCRPSFGADRQ